MASSRRPWRNAPATAGANRRDCLRQAEKAIQRSIIRPMDHADIINITTTTPIATPPIWEAISCQLMAVSFGRALMKDSLGRCGIRHRGARTSSRRSFPRDYQQPKCYKRVMRKTLGVLLLFAFL